MDQRHILNMLASFGRGGKGKAKASPGSESSPQDDSRASDRVNAIIDAWKREQDGSQGKFDLEGTLKSIVTKQDDVAAGGQVPRSMTDPDYGAEEPTGKQPSRTSTAADMLQLGLDAVGVVDPTPVTDGVNAAISLGRAFITDPERRGEHLQNAAISTVSMVPYIGDTAKLAKGGRAARTVSRAASHASGGAVTMAEKQAARERLRANAGGGFGDSEYAPGGPGGGGPIEPPPSPGDPNPDDANNEQSKWNQKLKDGTEKVVEFTGWIGKTLVKGAALIESLNLLNTGILALNRDYENYNGKIASSYAKGDVRNVQRSIAEGKELEGPLSSLNESQSELKDNISKVTTPILGLFVQVIDLLTKIANVALALLSPLLLVIRLITSAISKIVEAIEFIVWCLEQILELLGIKKPVDPANSDWRTFFHDVSDGKFDGRKPEFGTTGKIHSRQILPNADHKDVFGP